jgi:hypothetical protein
VAECLACGEALETEDGDDSVCGECSDGFDVEVVEDVDAFEWDWC